MSDIYFGIVEDRDDPLMIGRCKVRVMGIHTSDKTILPTSDLPWSYPLLSITSASISGIGESATGLLNGSLVAINFLDSAFQCPIMIGSIPGLPQPGEATTEIQGDATPQPQYSSGDGDTPPPVNTDGTPMASTQEGGGMVLPPIESAPNFIGPLSSDDYLKLREVIAKSESGGKPNNGYSAVNSLGFCGRYQFGGPLLQDLGYVKKGYKSKDLANSECWIGKDGINSREDFLKNHAIQDACMEKFTRMNFATVRRAKQLRDDSERNHCAGLLAACHLQGPGGAIKFAKGVAVKPDAYGTTTEKYYKLGYASLDGALPTVMPTEDSALPHTETITKATTGFGDPDGVYPKRNALLEPDSSRLARGQNIGNTIVGEKEADRELNVRVAGSNVTWDQPHIPYCGRFPYNKVMTTEAGLIQEFDSTPGAVRYNLHHPSGTFTEIDNNGTTVNRIFGDKFEILERDGNVFIKGDLNITVEGNVNILSQNDVNLEVYGNCNAIVKNDFNTTVHGNMNTFVQGDYNIQANSFNVETTAESVNIKSAKDIKTKSLLSTEIKTEEDFSVQSSKGINTYSSESTSILSKNDFKLESEAKISLKASSSLDADASQMNLQNGMSQRVNQLDLTDASSSLVALPSTNPDVMIKDPTTGKLKRQEHVQNDIPALSPVVTRFDGMSRLYDSPDDTGGDKEAFIKDLSDKTGVDINSIPDPSPTEGTFSFNKDKNIKLAEVDYSLFVNEVNIPTGINISPNYSLKQFLAPSDNIRKIVPQHGLSEGELVQNLQYLANNIAEKVKSLYPEMFITSAYRYSKTGSQHEKAMAMDMQFHSTKKQDYYAIAVALADILPIDQLILEYKDFGSGMPWIHASFNKENPRGEIYTYFNNKKHSNGLVQLA